MFTSEKTAGKKVQEFIDRRKSQKGLGIFLRKFVTDKTISIPATVIGLIIAFCVYRHNSENTRHARFIENLRIAREIVDAAKIDSFSPCGPRGEALTKSPFDTKRARLESHCTACLEYVSDGPQTQNMCFDLLEIAQFLEYCGNFKSAKLAVNKAVSSNPAFSVQVNANAILASVCASTADYASAEDAIHKARDAITNEPSIGDAERKIWLNRLQVTRAVVEYRESPRRQNGRTSDHGGRGLE